MKTTAQSLNEELGTDLLAQLSVDDQREVDKLNDQIQTLTTENRTTLKERVRVRDWMKKEGLPAFRLAGNSDRSL